MQHIRQIMGMPVRVEIVDPVADEQIFQQVFARLVEIDERFSPFKQTSEVSAINRGEIKPVDYSLEMKKILDLARETKAATKGYFDVYRADGKLDPSGLVKGWAIAEAADLIKTAGYQNFLVEIAGDIQVQGHNAEGQAWQIGLQDPFLPGSGQIVKVLYPRGAGVATSGTYLQGQHIYNPLEPDQILSEVLSLTVIGPNIYEADRMATAAFAMGPAGINFIEQLSGFEAYQINQQGIATMTTNFDSYTHA